MGESRCRAGGTLIGRVLGCQNVDGQLLGDRDLDAETVLLGHRDLMIPDHDLEKEGFDRVCRYACCMRIDGWQMAHAAHGGMDSVFFGVLMVVRTGSLLFGGPGCPSLKIRMNGRSYRQRVVVAYYLIAEVHGIQGKRQVRRAVGSVGRQTRRNRETIRAQSGRRVEETFHDIHSDGRHRAGDALLCRDISRDPDSDSVLDLCACLDHDHEDRGQCRRSTGLSLTDSDGTQP